LFEVLQTEKNELKRNLSRNQVINIGYKKPRERLVKQ